ncbi:MAG: family 10 glycosylhydrolase [Dysgonamonadaceae bacterium]|jgi:uncharacterized lipoprotein YddW (UPF0748 family)|nr:family 10 glycosylhydrolase [Dysgonamonadaceae bacterium]
MKQIVVLFMLLFSFWGGMAFAQSPPKREMRATWIATVTRIDWPKESGATAQKNEMLRMLDSIQRLNMNAVFFQIRSRCDAMYNSAFEPWSSDLGIARGTHPGYDPLAFVIEECHKRGIECHAWLNPYRYSRDGNGWTGANDNALNYEKTHPEWLLWYANNVVCDPALPEVRIRIKSVVGDIISKYDVDGIIFDDYFYPYGGTTNQDAASQATYKPAGMNVHDWRRDNVNRMIADVYDTIQAVRPWVTFGVSPFGIWTTDASVAAKEGITLPSGITGGNMYQEIYCDPLAWLKQGTVDYISPQLYWKTGGSQDYNTLCPWWADLANKFGVQFYSSMANYKYAEKTDAAYTVTELANQSLRNRSSAKDDAPGHVFYNTRAWVYDIPFRKKFKEEIFTKPSLTPAIGWKPANDQRMVTFNPPTGSAISWLYNETTDSVRYAVYAVPIARINDPSVFSKSDYLLGVSYVKRYTLPSGVSTSSHRIAVSVLDRYGNEFAPRVLGVSVSEMEQTQLIYPDDYAQVRIPVVFRWSAIDKIDCYVWQLATDADFTDIVCTRETTDNQFNTSVQLNIKEDGGTYYWRVRTRKANARDIWSETRRVILSSGGGSGLDAIPETSGNLKAWLSNDNLLVETAVACPAVIRTYSLSGQLLSVLQYHLQNGKNIIPFDSSYTGVSLVGIRTENDEATVKVYNH